MAINKQDMKGFFESLAAALDAGRSESFQEIANNELFVKALICFYTTGKKIEFNYDGEYTYHLPGKIFKDHDLIVEYFEGIWGLYYGNHNKYIVAVGKVIEIAKQGKDNNG